MTLPEDIGISEKLEKLRITSNQIKRPEEGHQRCQVGDLPAVAWDRLPYSILKLWKNATPPGQLEEWGSSGQRGTCGTGFVTFLVLGLSQRSNKKPKVKVLGGKDGMRLDES